MFLIYFFSCYVGCGVFYEIYKDVNFCWRLDGNFEVMVNYSEVFCNFLDKLYNLVVVGIFIILRKVFEIMEK